MLQAPGPQTNGTDSKASKHGKTNGSDGKASKRGKSKYLSSFISRRRLKSEPNVTPLSMTPLHFAAPLLSLRTVNGELVPQSFSLILDALQQHVAVEGIFRVNGDYQNIKRIMSEANTAPDAFPDLKEQPAVDLASLLKYWLGELPDPLIPEIHYDNVCDAGKTHDKGKLTDVITSLDIKSAGVLTQLIQFMATVADQSEVNKMTPHNLAVVLTPCLLRKEDELDPMKTFKDIGHLIWCVETMIDHFSIVFAKHRNHMRRDKSLMKEKQSSSFFNMISPRLPRLRSSKSSKSERSSAELETSAAEYDEFKKKRVQSINVKMDKLDKLRQKKKERDEEEASRKKKLGRRSWFRSGSMGSVGFRRGSISSATGSASDSSPRANASADKATGSASDSSPRANASADSTAV